MTSGAAAKYEQAIRELVAVRDRLAAAGPVDPDDVEALADRADRAALAARVALRRSGQAIERVALAADYGYSSGNGPAALDRKPVECGWLECEGNPCITGSCSDSY